MKEGGRGGPIGGEGRGRSGDKPNARSGGGDSGRSHRCKAAVASS